MGWDANPGECLSMYDLSALAENSAWPLGIAFRLATVPCRFVFCALSGKSYHTGRRVAWV